MSSGMQEMMEVGAQDDAAVGSSRASGSPLWERVPVEAMILKFSALLCRWGL